VLVPKSVREIAANMQSPAMQSIQKMLESNRLADSFAVKSVWEIAANMQSPAMQSIQKMLESNRLADSFAVKSAREIAANMQSPAMQSFQKILELIEPYQDSEVMITQEAIDFMNERSNEIIEELITCIDFNQLSNKSKSCLLYIYHNYLLPFLISCCATIYMNNADIARKEFESISTTNEVKALIKNPNVKFDRNLLKNYRVVIGNETNLRDEPNIKSNIITTLPVGTLVEIIEKSNRSWLLVEIEINGEIEQGWIFRKYTEYFR
jgi:hypothetical protein